MDKCKDQTVKWLQDNHIPFDQIHMRKTNDFRSDSIVKEEIYNEHIKDKYNVISVFDDRNQTVAKWRELGLLTFQVADGNF